MAKAQSQVEVILSAFKHLDFPVLVVSEAGEIFTASKGAESLLPALMSGPEACNFGDMLVEPPDDFSRWLHDLMEGHGVRLRQRNGSEMSGIVVKALPLDGSPRRRKLWVLNLHREESFSRQKYEREILLRISSVPIPEMTSEGQPFSPAAAEPSPITRELLDMIVKYLAGDAALLLRLEEAQRLSVIGQCGFSSEALARLLERLESGDIPHLNQGIIREAVHGGFTYSLSDADEPEEQIRELAKCLPFESTEIWVDGVSGFGAVLTFFAAPPSYAARQFATDAYVRLGRHLESSVYNKHLYEAYLKLQQTQEQIIQSGKMAAIGELATGMAHELRQPVTAINNFLTTIFDHLETGQSGKLEGRLADFKTRFKRNIERLSNIIDHLRTFGRQEAVNFQATDLRPFLEDIFKTFLDAQLAERDVVVRWEIPDDLPPVEIDGPRIEQVVLNLLNNAKDALEEIEHPVIIIRGQCMKERVLLTVCDNGPGIPEEHLDKVLNPFFTTKAVGKGTGLGLSVSHGIVEGHNGTLHIKNNPDGGACFTIDLPIRQPERKDAPGPGRRGISAP